MDRRKELREQYKARKVIGGIYRILNTVNGRFFLQSTTDMQAARNRFQGVNRSDVCTLPPLQRDWREFGAAAFVFEELDWLEKGAEQTDAEFKEDIKALLELWEDKLPPELRY